MTSRPGSRDVVVSRRAGAEREPRDARRDAGDDVPRRAAARRPRSLRHVRAGADRRAAGEGWGGGGEGGQTAVLQVRGWAGEGGVGRQLCCR